MKCILRVKKMGESTVLRAGGESSRERSIMAVSLQLRLIPHDRPLLLFPISFALSLSCFDGSHSGVVRDVDWCHRTWWSVWYPIKWKECKQITRRFNNVYIFTLSTLGWPHSQVVNTLRRSRELKRFINQLPRTRKKNVLSPSRLLKEKGKGKQRGINLANLKAPH